MVLRSGALGGDQSGGLHPGGLNLCPDRRASGRELVPLRFLLPCEDKARGAICKAESKPSPDTESVGALILDFPVSRTVKNNIFVFHKAPSLWLFLNSISNELRHKTVFLFYFT